MIAYIVKKGRVYHARFRVEGESKITQVSLGCADARVAEKRLQEMVSEKEREAAGLIAPKLERESAKKTMTEHLEDMVEEKERKRDGHYLSNLKGRVQRMVKDCGWKYAKDVTAESFEEWRARLDLSAKALNEYLTSIRTLLNWMERRGRIGANPLKTVEALAKDEEKRYPRRALSEEELGRVVNAAGERGLVYLIAATTGLRLGELLKLETRDIRLEGSSGKILARAATTKNRKKAEMALHSALVERLRTYLAERGCEPDDNPFRELLPRGQFKRDLAAAKIAERDEAGLVVDFHSLRHTFCTNLQRLNAPERVLMHLMRHSDRRLSDVQYTDTRLLPTEELVQKLAIPGGSGLSHIRSQNLVFSGLNGSHAVTAANGMGTHETMMNTGFCYTPAFGVKASQESEMVLHRSRIANLF